PGVRVPLYPPSTNAFRSRFSGGRYSFSRPLQPAGASRTIDAMDGRVILSKAQARAAAYAGLHEAKAARFPFPIEGRNPNFIGAEKAARILRALPVYQKAQLIKVNPDAPQRPVRAMALADGKSILVPRSEERRVG